jgi:4-amino-4-deoxy-L-arabinose transferase-like glycosyltransferase
MKQTLTWVLLGLVLMGALLTRAYNFRDHLTFQSDQGRDAMIAKAILRDGDIALIGPVTSVGNMYLGPFYYYFMVPFLALTYPDPAGPAYAILVFSLLTVAGVYAVGARVFNRRTGLMAAGIMAFMGVAITYGRFSWNPNIAPFLGLGLFYATYQAMVEKQLSRWPVVGLLLALLLQSHYVTLAAIPAVLLAYVLSRPKEPTKRRKWLKMGAMAGLIVALSFLPLIIFNFRHQGIISQGFRTFITSEEEHLRPVVKVTKTVKDLELRSWLILAQFMGSREAWSNRLVVVLALVGSGWLLAQKGGSLSQRRAWLLVNLFIIASIVTTAFYTSTVFSHYVLYILPIVALFFGHLGYQVTKKLPSGYALPLATVALASLAYLNLAPLPFWRSQTPALDLYHQAAEDTLVHLPEGKYNLLLISTQRDYYGLNYRYFFETSQRQPAAQDDYRDLNYLVVIDELKLDNPLEVNAFEMLIAGPKRLVNQFQTNLNTMIWIYQIVDEDSES